MKILVIGKEGRLEKYTKDRFLLDKYTIIHAPAGASDDQLLSLGRDAEFILVDAIGKVSANLINSMPNLKMIHSEGVAYNGIDINAAKEKEIYVCNCKGMNATAVAEQTILLMLGLLRDVVMGDRNVREGNQIDVKERYMATASLKELADCTVGLIGFGDIAQAVAKYLSVFGAKVVYYNRSRRSAALEQECGVTYSNLDGLLAYSDMVSLHLAVTPDTEKIVNRAFLNKMKKGSYLINTARGELIDAEALLDALRSGHIAGAGLDTLEGEPVQKDNVMLTAEKEVEDKIIYSPHIGGITASSFQRGYDMIWSDMEKVAAGEVPDHVVNGW
ncbi:MAG: NAD(P)-binding domain-containing protein [Clostridiales bacterium]|nr:NAD(P)-binding domain-containing protein [Clostridiales bacterium]